MKKKLKGIALALVLIMGISIINNSTSVVAKTKDTNERTNFEILTEDENKVIYTYEEGDKKYRVEEYITKDDILDTSIIESTIYEIKNNRQNEVIYTLESKRENNTFTVKISKDGKTTTEVLDFNNNLQESYFNRTITPFEDDMTGGSGGIKWNYILTSKSSNSIENFTYAAIKDVILYLSKANAKSVAGGLLITVCGTIANTLFSAKAKYVYRTTVSYGCTNSGSSVITGHKAETTFYKDSARTQKVGTALDYYWL